MGGKFLPKLNICGRPIANKYREGKMKRTLKRESKVLEIAEIEGMATSVGRVLFLCVVGFCGQLSPACVRAMVVVRVLLLVRSQNGFASVDNDMGKVARVGSQNL